uniref:Uncharacterized protein n=1 Tax=Arundo donax TaxID=35708 RepID=A0A0A9BGN1_ARUDO
MEYEIRLVNREKKDCNNDVNVRFLFNRQLQ